jgi:ribosomal protein S27E
MKLSDRLLKKYNYKIFATPKGIVRRRIDEPPKLMPKGWQPSRIPKTRVKGTRATRRWKTKSFRCPYCGFQFTTIVYKTHTRAQCPVCSSVAYSR